MHINLGLTRWAESLDGFERGSVTVSLAVGWGMCQGSRRGGWRGMNRPGCHGGGLDPERTKGVGRRCGWCDLIVERNVQAGGIKRMALEKCILSKVR